MSGSAEPHGVAGPSAADGLLLAGDIGGTKTILGIYSQDAGPQRPLAVRTYPSAKYPSLEAIVREFLATVHLPVDQACFDLAGPISGGRATLTNLPWEPIEAPALAEALGLDSVRLLNDLEAIALGITELHPRNLRVLQRHRRVAGGAIAVVAPGTGLGEAFCVWNGHRYLPSPSEGGHGDFAPGTNAKRSCSCTCRPATATSAGSWSAPASASRTSMTSWLTPASRPSPTPSPAGSPRPRTGPARSSRPAWTHSRGRHCARRRCDCSAASSGPRRATWPSPYWPRRHLPCRWHPPSGPAAASQRSLPGSPA